MGFLPIVARELRQATRRTSIYWTRLAAAGAVSAILSGVLATAPQNFVSGGRLFGVLSGVALGCCLLAGVRYTSDALSKERRDGTLGLLFLSRLSGFDVVLGKLAVTSMDAFFILLSILPLLGIPLVFGGVNGPEFYRMVLLLLNTTSFH